MVCSLKFHYSFKNASLNFFIHNTEGDTEGIFLVRESPTVDGAFILSVLHEGEPRHYQINRHGADAFFSIGEKKNADSHLYISLNMPFIQRMDTLFMVLMPSLVYVKKKVHPYLDPSIDLARKISHLLIPDAMVDVTCYIEPPKKVGAFFCFPLFISQGHCSTI